MLAGVRRDQKTSADRVRLRTNQGGADRFRGEGGEGSERSVHSGRLRVESKLTIGDHAMNPTVTSENHGKRSLMDQKRMGRKKQVCIAALIYTSAVMSLSAWEARPEPRSS